MRFSRFQCLLYVFVTVSSTRPIFSKSVNYCLNCHLPVGDVCATNGHCVESVGHKRATLQRLKTDLVKAIGGKLLKMKSLPPKGLLFSYVALFFHSSLRRSNACDGHTERTTRYVVHAKTGTEFN